MTKKIQGLSHITFIVKDLTRAARFFCDGLGAQEIYDSKKKNFSISHEKYFVIGDEWIVAMEGEPSERSYRHVAFKIDDDALPSFREKLEALGVEIQASRSRVEGEGRSLYFYDFDNNLFELHTGTLKQRLQRYNS